jgi:energy-coupling factor transport system ATP-binding protein
MVTHDDHISKNFATRIWTVKDGNVISDENIVQSGFVETKVKRSVM